MKWIPELPLLRRELTELANRRRTYVVRVVGAVVVLFFVFVAYEQAMANRLRRPGFGIGGPNQYWGIGREIFARITPTLFYTIQLLMPAFCCACITSEKESNTIGTLLLTRLSPGTIIAEKFFSRLVPMLTLLLLTFPMLAHVLSLGGVDTELLIGTLWLLFCECILFASIALVCSAWFSTTVSAFTVSYCLTGMLAIMSMSLEVRTFVPSAIWRSIYVFGLPLQVSPPTTFFFQSLLTFTGVTNVNQPPPMWLLIMIKSIPSLVVTFCCLLAARLLLVSRAFTSHSSVLMKLFKALDRFFKDLNDRTTGGILLVRDSDRMPEDAPVTWREQNKKSLGKARYLFRMLLFLEGPTLFVCMLAASLSAQNAFEGLYVLQTVVWILATLVAAVKGATLFSSERAKQTIEPLLATPMTSVDMLNQKVAGMRRLLIVLAIPILTVNFTHFILNVDVGWSLSLRAVTYAFLSVWSTFVLLYLITWTSAGIGLKVHSQTKAVLMSVTFLGLWAAVPMVAMNVFSLPHRDALKVFTCSLLSPVMFTEAYLREAYLKVYEDGQLVEAAYLLPAMISVASYTVIVIAVRWCVQLKSPRLLNRGESVERQDTSADVKRVHALESVQP